MNLLRPEMRPDWMDGVRRYYSNLSSRAGRIVSDEERSMLTPSVSQALESVYDAFATQRPPSEIEACPHCHEADELCSLLVKPLRRLTADELGGYAASALLTAGSEVDFKYFLPRMLEISLEDPAWWPSREVLLGKLPLAHWERWSQRQVDALGELFDAAFEHAVAAGVADEIDSWICALALTGFEIDPYLERLEACAAPAVLVSLFERNAVQIQRGKLANAFWKDQREESAKFLQWLESPLVQAAVRAQYGTGGGDR